MPRLRPQRAWIRRSPKPRNGDPRSDGNRETRRTRETNNVMALTRREFVVGAAGLFGCALTGWGAPQAEPLRTAAGFFAARQSRDGAWRSDSYAVFRGGDALTPVVLWALHSTDNDATARGLHWLEELTDSQTRLAAVAYPLFTSGYAAQVFAASGDTHRAAVWASVIES